MVLILLWLSYVLSISAETENIALNACVLECRDSELPAKETEAGILERS